MTDEKRAKLRRKVEKGTARQQARENSKLLERAADAKDRVARAAGEHPILLIAGGLAVGVALSTIIPKSPTRKLSKHAFGLIASLAEVGLAYGKHAFGTVGAAAEEVARTGKARLEDLRAAQVDAPETASENEK